MLFNFGLLIAGLALLYYGAEFLVKGCAELALRFGVSPLAVGLTVVAFGTSAPEIAASMTASSEGNGGLAIGNVVGSNICNLALVLGVAGLIKPLVIHRQVVKRDMPILLLATGLVTFFLLNDGDEGLIGRTEGAILFAGVVIYAVASLMFSKKEDNQDIELEELSAEEVEAAKHAGPAQVMWFLFLIAIGFVGLVFGASWLVKGGVAIATWLEVPQVLIGLSLVAVGTSLPELATTLVATSRGHTDMVTGNAVGSCIFNLLAVLGLTSIFYPISAEGLQTGDLWAMVGLTLLMWPFMASGRNISRLEGLVLLGGYGGYVYYLTQVY